MYPVHHRLIHAGLGENPQMARPSSVIVRTPYDEGLKDLSLGGEPGDCMVQAPEKMPRQVPGEGQMEGV